MKKPFLIFSFFSFIFSLGITFAYTSEDTSNANFLADQGIITKQTVASKYRLDDKILRQEVIGMALKVKGITLPENYKCKKYFTDTTKNDWVCRAIEIAADNGIITKGNKNANPGKYVTRAEALAMVMKAGGFTEELSEEQLYSLEYSRIYFDTNITWHKDIILQAMFYNIIDSKKYLIDTGNIGSEGSTGNSTMLEMKFSPNRLATRAEVFGFAKKILSQSIIINPETRITIGSSPEIYIRPTTESESPEEKFMPSNNLSKLFLTQNHIGTIFHNEDNLLALSFFVLNEAPIYDEKGYFYYGGLATSKANLRILRNMVYARHGRHFESKDLQDFFKTQSWYQENPNYTNADITSIDQRNIDFIQREENFLKD